MANWAGASGHRGKDQSESGKGNLTPQDGWNSRRVRSVDDENQLDTACVESGRSSEQEWGAVLTMLGVLIIFIALTITYSVFVGGIFGILTVETALITAGLLVGLGGIGLVQGMRARRGR